MSVRANEDFVLVVGKISFRRGDRYSEARIRPICKPLISSPGNPVAHENFRMPTKEETSQSKSSAA